MNPTEPQPATTAAAPSRMALTTNKSGAAIGFEPQNLQEAMQICCMLAATKFLPEAIQTPEQALAIMLAGRELGLPMMVSFRSIELIKGKVTIKAASQLSLIIKAGIRYKWIEKSNSRACIELERDGILAEQFEFTIDDAVRAQLPGKNRDGTPNNWIKYPAAMLRARAITAAIRAYCPDVLDAYDPEELAEPQQVQGARIDVPSHASIMDEVAPAPQSPTAVADPEQRPVEVATGSSNAAAALVNPTGPLEAKADGPWAASVIHMEKAVAVQEFFGSGQATAGSDTPPEVVTPVARIMKAMDDAKTMDELLKARDESKGLEESVRESLKPAFVTAQKRIKASLKP